MHVDPHWPRAAHWLQDASGSDVRILGVPINRSITPGHCDEAPKALRDALLAFSVFGGGQDLRELAVTDFGDLDAGLEPTAYDQPVADFLRDGQKSLNILIGGDNGLTRPGVLGLGVPITEVGLITIDAHFDLRTTANGLHNGNPIRALLEQGMPGGHISQIGIADFANSPDYAKVARDAEIHVVFNHPSDHINMADQFQYALDRLSRSTSAIYVDIDLDTIDRAFVPGCPGARPGGCTPADIYRIAAMAGGSERVRAVDIVEFDPSTDINRQTAMVAAGTLLHLLRGAMHRR